MQLARLDGLVSGLSGEGAGWAKITLARRQCTETEPRATCRPESSYRPDQVLSAEVRISQGQFWTVSDRKVVVQRWYGVTYRSATSYQTLSA